MARIKVGNQFVTTGKPIDIGQINSDFFLNVKRGLITGWTCGILKGYNDLFSSSEASLGGTTFQFPIAAQSLEAVSNDAFDTSVGSGAQTIFVTGLDANFNAQTETVTMNGTTPVALVNSYIRILDIYVVNCGTYDGNNIGKIDIRITGGGTVYNSIIAGFGESQNLMYTVPAGKTLYLYQLHLFPETAKDVRFRLWKRHNADDVTTPFTAKRIINRYVGLSAPVVMPYFDCPTSFEEKTDVWMTCLLNSGGGNAAAGAEFVYLLQDN